MATKIICFMEAKSYGGSWGVADTEKEAQRIAKTQLGGAGCKSKKFIPVEVPEGRKLVVESTITGIQWYTVPEEEIATS